jgi:chromate reductase, NAD(P)H dehydrogenase (quinone)
VNVVGISGSLQARSSNRALIDLARELGGDAVSVREYRGVDALPHFNPDLDGEGLPASVSELRALVGSADGVLIATPEYAFGIPGALKNALDWLVGSGDLYDKPVAVVSAAPSLERGVNARSDLERTLRGQGARVIASSTIAVPNGRSAGVVSDQTARDALVAILQAFRDATAPDAGGARTR